MKTYSAHSVTFEYPPDWEIQEQHQGSELLINVSSPETSFWSLGLFFESPSAEHVVQTVLRALEDDYQEIDIYESRELICDRPTIARDAEFVCMELLNSVWIRAFQTRRFTALVMYQSTDHELETTLPLLERITHSFACAEDVDDEEDPYLLDGTLEENPSDDPLDPENGSL